MTNDFSWPMEEFEGWSVTAASRAGTSLRRDFGAAREPWGQILCKLRDSPHGAPWLNSSHGG